MSTRATKCLNIYLLILLVILSGAQPAVAESFTATEVITFSSPESALPAVVSFIYAANTSLYVNAYTFTSEHIARALLAELERGTRVVLLVDGAPAGGIPGEELRLLRALSGAGAEVFFYRGPLRFNHAKYIIADNTSVLITTENFVEGSFPLGRKGNRGWGAVVYSAELAGYLAEVFLSDLAYGERLTGGGEYLPQVKPPRNGGERYTGSFTVKPVVAPENAIGATLQLLRSANRSLYIQQFYIYTYWGRAREDSPETAPNLFLEEAINAARRGVEVKILLDSTWYNVRSDDPRSNLRTVSYVNEIAQKEKLPLEARLAWRDEKITKYHLKGVVVDGEAVLLGSMNWNEHSPKKNREVSVIIYGAPAAYFERLFLEDWKRSGGEEGAPPELFALMLIIGMFILVMLKRRARRLIC